MNNAGKSEYWDSFYVGRTVPPAIPSQFAAFVLNESINFDAVIEIGCGSGRDAEFFATYGRSVLALDASSQAIDLCRSRQTSRKIKYIATSSMIETRSHVSSFVDEQKKVVLYARFFLHAISDDDETDFIEMISSVIPRESIVAFEYRTTGDSGITKEFGSHYRRFIEHKNILRRLTDAGFRISYETEGRGYAKFRDEDALVGRCLAIR